MFDLLSHRDPSQPTQNPEPLSPDGEQQEVVHAHHQREKEAAGAASDHQTKHREGQTGWENVLESGSIC